MLLLMLEQFVVASMRVAILDPALDAHRMLIDVAPNAKVDTRIALGMALGMYRLCTGCGDLVARTPDGWCHFHTRPLGAHDIN